MANINVLCIRGKGTRGNVWCKCIELLLHGCFVGTVFSFFFFLNFEVACVLNNNLKVCQFKIPTDDRSFNIKIGGFEEKAEVHQKPTFMTISGRGRLGNKMFQYAALLAACQKHGCIPFIRRWDILNTVFEINQIRDLNTTNWISVGENRSGFYDSGLENLTRSKNYTLAGYYQSWRYFHSISETVRTAFKIKQTYSSEVRHFLSVNNVVNRTRIAVHVRRGDYLWEDNVDIGYTVATQRYFENAMEYFRVLVQNPIFIVITDDHKWCWSNFQGNDIIYTVKGSRGRDFELFSHCNHAIISVGTFGWWGAYLAGGIVIYYNGYPAPGSWLAGQYNKKDYYPRSWIPME